MGKVQEKVQEIVSELVRMSVDELDVDENLLELGVDSILVTELISHIKNEFNVEIPMKLFFSDTTSIAQISSYIEENMGEEVKVAVEADMNEKQEEVIEQIAIVAKEEQPRSTEPFEVLSLQVPENIEPSSCDPSVLNLLEQQVQLLNNQLILLQGRTVISNTTKTANPAHKTKDVQTGNMQTNAVVDKKETSKETEVSKKYDRKNAYVPFKKLNFEKKQLTEQRKRCLEKVQELYTEKTKSSKAYAAKYRKPYADCRSVSGFRPNMKEMCYQLIFKSSQGAYITDIDDNQYIDLAMDFGVSLFGHNQQFISDAIKEEMEKGYPLSLVSGLSGEVAELFCKMTEMERLAFFNSGTEAVMVAVRISRAYTGRKKIVVFAGSYHGTFDGVLGMSGKNSDKTSPIAKGILQEYVNDLIVLDYGSDEALDYIEKHREEIAAVLVEPVQSRRPDLQPREFILKLREQTQRDDIILIFDEMILGFRLGKRGAQGFYGIHADLATYGKICGGGLPIGIVAGKEKYMNCIDGGVWNYGDDSYPPDEEKRTFVAGTFCHHPLSMAAAKAVLTKIDESGEAVYEDINQKTNYLCDNLNRYFVENSIPIKMTHCGSLFRFVLKGNLELFYYLLNLKGVYIWEGRNCFISASHTYNDLDKVIDAVKWACNELRSFFDLKGSLKDSKEIPFSQEQQEIIAFEQMSTGTKMNEVCLVKMEGCVSKERLASAYKQVCQRHEILRYHLSKDMSCFVENDKPDFQVAFSECTEEQIMELCTEEENKPFDLTEGLLIRMNVFSVHDNLSYLFLKAHHVLVDGWSISVILQEIVEVYNARTTNREPRLGEVMSYQDYMQQVRDFPVSSKQLNFMEQYAQDFKNVVLPRLDEERDSSDNKLIEQKDQEFLLQLRKAAKKLKCSTFMLMLSSFQSMLYFVTNRNEITLGIPYAGQQKFITNSIVGNCTKINKLKLYLDSYHSVNDIIQKDEKILNAYSETFGYSNPESENGNDQNVNIIFNADRIPYMENLEDVKISLVPMENQESAYDLFVNISEFNDHIVVETLYNKEKYSKSMINRWMELYNTILTQLCTKTNVQLCELDIMTDYDKKKNLEAMDDRQLFDLMKKLDISAERYGFSRERIAVAIKNNQRQPVLTGSYGYLYVGDTLNTCFATDYIARITTNGRLEVLGREKDCFIRNELFTGCYVIKEMLSKLYQFTYLKVEYADELICVYYDAEDIEEAVQVCMEKLDISYRPDKFFCCKNHVKEITYPVVCKECERNEIEESIYQKVCEVLGCNNIGLDDNVTNIGLTSLKMMQLVAKLQDAFAGVRIPIAELDGIYTIRRMAKIITEQQKKGNCDFPVLVSGMGANLEGTLSNAQKRMYILNKVQPEDLNYNLPFMLTVEGILDKEKLENAIKECIQLHPMLRCQFYEEVGEIRYQIEDTVTDIVQWEQYSGEESEEDFIARKRKEFVKPFALLKEKLFRILVINYKEQKTFILVDFHHIIFDGRSASILIGSLYDLYNGNAVESSKYTYSDYVGWQKELEKTGYYQSELAFWKDKLNTNYASLDMLLDYTRPEELSINNSGQYDIQLSAELVENLKEKAKKLECSLFSIFTAASSLALSMYSGEKEFLIGTVVEGRNDVVLQNILGMFVNTIPLLQSIDETLSLDQYIKATYKNNLEALENSDIPFETIVELSKERIVKNRNPLFNFLISYHDDDITGFDLGGLWAEVKDIEVESSRFELELVVNCTNQAIRLNMLYAKQLYSTDKIRRLVNAMVYLLDLFTKDTETKINEIEYCTTRQLNEAGILQDRVNVGYPKEATIKTLFEEQVEKWPERIAVTFQEQSLTYKQLNERANQLAHSLLRAGVNGNQLIAIVTERSLEMVIGILAIVKAGCAYVPIDPIYPEERRNYIIEDSGVSIILKGNVEIICSEDKKVISLYDESSYQDNKENPDIDCRPEDALYVIYTSGTTGKPKGVLIEHRNVVRLMKNEEFQFDFSENDCWTMFHSFCFDFSVWEMYGALLFGGKLVVVPREAAQNSNEFLKMIQKEQVTILNQVPSAFYQLMSMDEAESYMQTQSLRYLIFGGEALQPKRLKEWHQNHRDVKIINMYGITETTVHVTYKEIGDQEIENGISDIGSAIPTLGIYIMRGNQLCDIGMPGEICVYGAGLGRCYLNREELTSSKFVKNPYREGRLYRSGDLARMLPDGGIEYLGRIDQQIKIRGFRIELDEITTVLRNLEEIQDAVVIIKKDANGENAIHAYIVSDEEIDFASVRRKLKSGLPEYMIPAYFCQIDKVPLTLNGKLNRKELPDITLTSSQCIQPRNEIEATVLDIFLQTLNIKEMGISDNFFEYGGHSLKAVEVINSIRKEFGVSISLNSFFNNGTVENVVALVMEKNNTEEAQHVPELERVEERTEGVLSLNQKELYIAASVAEEPEVYNICYPIVLNSVEPDIIRQTVEQVLERHSILRTQFFKQDDEVMQRIMPVQNCIDRVFKYIQKEEDWSQNRIERFIKVYENYKFNLLDDYLLRMHLIKIDVDKYLFIYLTHHIISDAWSFRVFMKDFIQIYTAIEKGSPIKLEPLPVQYIDYSVWQRKLFETDQFMKKESQYWMDVLSGDLPQLELHTDFERTLPRSMKGSSIDIIFNKEELERLKALSIEHNGSMFTSFVSVINILLYMYTGQSDIILGTIVAGRNNWKLEQQIGYYLNMIPLRTKFDSNSSIEEVVDATTKICKDAFEYQDYPFEKIVANTKNKAKAGRGQLFDILVQYINWNEQVDDEQGMDFEIVEMKSEQSKYDLVFNFVQMGDQVKLTLEYCTKLFKRETIERMGMRFQVIMQKVLSEKTMKINQITTNLSAQENYGKIQRIKRR